MSGELVIAGEVQVKSLVVIHIKPAVIPQFIQEGSVVIAGKLDV